MAPSVKIVDSGTPANDVDTTQAANFSGFNDVLAYPAASTSPKMVLGSTGLMRYAAHNLLLQSEDFSTTWVLNGDLVLVSSTISAPDGTNTAAHISGTTSSLNQNSVVSGTDKVKAIWARTVSGTGTTALGGFNGIAKYQVTLTEEWQRFTFDADAGETGGTTFYGVDFRYGTLEEVYIWHPQLYAAPADETYLPTTNVARYALPVEYDTSGNAIGVLVEPQATNNTLQSNKFADGAWANNSTVTANYGTGPDGIALSSSRLQFASSSFVQQSLAVSTSVTNTVSVYARSTNGGVDQNFRLKCTHGGVADYFSTDLVATSAWQRFDFSQVFGGGGSATIAGVVGPSAGTTDIEVAYFQTEFDTSVATSPIVTAGSTVTRLADGLSILTSAFPHADGAAGTLFFSGVTKNKSSTVTLEIGDGSSADRLVGYTTSGGGAPSVLLLTAGAVQADDAYSTALTNNVAFKHVISVDTDDVSHSLDGGAVETDTSATLNTGNTTLYVGQSYPGTTVFNGHIKSIAYIPERVSNANLQAMTTL